MLASSSTWSTILFLSTLFTFALSQRCGGTIEGGAGVIQSPSYPHGYPASDCVWVIDSGAQTRIRIRFQDRDCRGDSLWIYDGNGTAGVPLLGQFCFEDPPVFLHSSGRMMTIKFMSFGGADNKQGFAISYESTLNPPGFFSIVPEDASIDIDYINSYFFMCAPKDETWSISWEKDDEPMENPTTRDGNLELLNIREEDEGKYTCVVRDPRGRFEGRAHAWLFFSDPPQIDISKTCGTITFWRNNIQPTQSPEVEATTEADGDEGGSFSWSSSGANRADDESGREVGGRIAKNGSAPFMVRIMEFRDREWIHRCGASLLDQSWILTAAHCMFEDGTQLPLLKENMDLFFGEYDTSIREGSEMQRRLAEIIVHEKFNHTTLDNDIALIRIEPPLRRFTPYIRPICLAPSGLSHHLMQNATLGRVTGWGRVSSRGPLSRLLKCVEVPFVDRQTCRESVADDTSVLTDNMFCAGYYSTKKDACGGDSGGPLAVRHDDGRWYQLGIVSWGIGCAARGEYGFYTRVSRFLDWIRSKEATVAYSPNVGRRFNESLSSGVLAFEMRSPSELTVAAGSKVDLECVPNRSDASVEWFIGNNLNPVNSLVDGVRILPSGLIFHFDAIEEAFSGVYSCVARVNDEEGEQTIRATFRLALNPLSFFSINPENASIDIDINFHFFMCTPKDETWSISWEKDDEPMENPTTRGGNLVLLDIREEDEGKYTCVVRDPRGGSEGRADAWLFPSDSSQIDISTTCGTITFWRDTIQPTPSPEVEATTEADGAEGRSFSWSSTGANQPNPPPEVVAPTDADGAEGGSFSWSSVPQVHGSGRVVGGNIAQKGSAPFMVRIMAFRDREWIHRCGATLLDQSWILTSAQCVFEERTVIPLENMNLFFGEYDTLIREDSEEQRRPAEIIVHEEYNQMTLDNDIALIRIEPPLREFTPYIRPICLAPSSLSYRLMQSFSLGRVTGWGRSSFRGPLSRFLKDVEVPFVDRQTCRESVADDRSVLTDNMFCAGYYSAGNDACGGDSGGPLAVRHDDGRWYQLGIVSWGIGCAARGEYGFYTRVSRFLDWIRAKEATVAYSPNVGRRFNESLSSHVLAFAMRSPSELTVAAGSKVDLECVPNRSDAFVAWFIGNSPNPVHSLKDGLRILPSGTVFHFDAIEEAFSGVYSCEARANDEDGEQTIRATFQLEVTPA